MHEPYGRKWPFQHAFKNIFRTNIWKASFCIDHFECVKESHITYIKNQENVVNQQWKSIKTIQALKGEFILACNITYILPGLSDNSISLTTFLIFLYVYVLIDVSGKQQTNKNMHRSL